MVLKELGEKHLDVFLVRNHRGRRESVPLHRARVRMDDLLSLGRMQFLAFTHLIILAKESNSGPLLAGHQRTACMHRIFVVIAISMHIEPEHRVMLHGCCLEALS